MMKEDTVRNIFIAVMIFLPLQYGLVGLTGYYNLSEPWPAFVFPGFKNVYVAEEDFKVNQTWFEIYSQESEVSDRFLPHEFFPDLPASQTLGFMRTHFRDHQSIERFSLNAKKWLKKHAEEVVSYEPVAMDVVHVEKYYSPAAYEIQSDSVVVVSRVTINFEVL